MAKQTLLPKLIDRVATERDVKRRELGTVVGRDPAYIDRLRRDGQGAELHIWQRIGRYLGIHDTQIALLYMRDQFAAMERESFVDLLNGRELPGLANDRNALLRTLIEQRPPFGSMASLLEDCIYTKSTRKPRKVLPGVSLKLVTYLWARTLQDHNQRSQARDYYTAAGQMVGDNDLDVSLMLSQANLCTEAGRPLGALGFFEEARHRQDAFNPRQNAFWHLFYPEARVLARLLQPRDPAAPPTPSELRPEFESDFETALEACRNYNNNVWWIHRCTLWLTYLRGEPVEDLVQDTLARILTMRSPRDAEADYTALAGALAMWQTDDAELERKVLTLVRKGEHGVAHHLCSSVFRPGASTSPSSP